MMVRLLIVCCLTLLLPTLMWAQPQLNPFQEQMVRAELDKRGFEGVSVDEMAKRLEAKGIDVSNPDPSQADAVQKALDEIFLEMEAEKEAKNPKVGQNMEAKPPSKAEQNADKQAELLKDAGVDKVLEAAKPGTNTVKDAPAPPKEPESGIADLIQITEQQKDELVYGQEIFLDLNMEAYMQNTQIRALDNYILGETDEIIINITGASADFSENYAITNGKIKPFKMDEIFLKGMTFGSAKQLLSKRFSQFYRFRDEDFQVSLNYSRNIIVNVTGMARNFGSFYIPAANTAFTALIAAKGPSKEGSVRNISIHSSGLGTKTFDLYEYLLKPDIANDFVLRNNDYVHIPIQGKVVSITGAVTRPRRYELKDSEQLKKLLFWAGGVKSNAYQKNITIVRYEDDQEKIINVDLRELNKSGRDFQLKDGDRIRVPVIPSSYKNFVSIGGSVELPGEYELIRGMRISDLVLQGQPGDLAKLDIAYLFRQGEGTEVDPIKVNLDEILNNPSSPTNMELQAKDKIRIFSKREFEEENRSISLGGAVYSPNNYAYSPNMKVSDVVTLSGGLKEDATGMAYIYRKVREGLEPNEYIRFNVFEAMKNLNSPDNISLQAGDQIRIFSYSQLRAGYSPTVVVSGAVRIPDEFPYSPNIRISDVLELSGGLEEDATGMAFILRRNLDGLEPTDYIRFNAFEILDKPGSTDDIALEPGDRIQVYSYSQLRAGYSPEVQVSGAVLNPSSYSYSSQMTLKDLLHLSGGLQLQADQARIDVYRVNIEQGEPTSIEEITVEVDEDYNVIGYDNGDFFLAPFDIVQVRYTPYFEMQQNVTIYGEVKYPGAFAITQSNERIADIIRRAGGFKETAYPQGMTIQRPGIGRLIIDVKDVLEKPKSPSNYIVQAGDIISIPKRIDLVFIDANRTKAEDEYTNIDGTVNVPYVKGKNAKFYVNEFLGGIDRSEGARYRLISVEQPGGKIDNTKDYGFFKKYPEVQPGAKITIGKIPEKERKEREDRKEREPVDWGEILANTVAQATAVLTLIILIQRIQ